MGSAHRHFAPSQNFTTADGKLLYLSIFAEEQWPRLCAALGHPEWAEEPRYKDNAARLQHRERLAQQIQACLQAKPAAYWREQLDRFKIPWAPVNTVGEALHDPQVLHNGMIVTMQHQRAGTIRVIGHPVKFSQTPARYTQPPPELGEHTESLLQELHYSTEEIHQLRREKVI
ncbi:MAG: CoA transferase [Nitrospinota bacterium]|nr:MAG: CoA transferase [Nitrospinota bacterium]